MPSLGDVLAIGCALAWATAVLAFRRLAEKDPMAVNLFKNAIATAMLAVTMLATGTSFDTTRSLADWASLIGSGVIGLAIADSLFLEGLRRVDGAVVAATDCAYFPAVLAMSVLFLGETVGRGLLVGAPLVMLGVAVVTIERRTTTRVLDRGGVGFALSGVLLTALGIVLAKGALDRSELLEATTIRLAAGTLGVLALGLARRGAGVFELFRPQPAWKPALVATFLGTYVSMLLWLGGMKYGQTSRTAILNQLGAIFVLLFSALSGEVITGRRWLGAGLAFAGVACVLLLQT